MQCAMHMHKIELSSYDCVHVRVCAVAKFTKMVV